jgi:hypothetical protein
MRFIDLTSNKAKTPLEALRIHVLGRKALRVAAERFANRNR